jgi:hypothetical protein
VFAKSRKNHVGPLMIQYADQMELLQVKSSVV